MYKFYIIHNILYNKQYYIILYKIQNFIQYTIKYKLKLDNISIISFVQSCVELAGGFPHSSVGKESTCNAGDPSLITGLGKSPGEGIGYPLQYSWASLVAQLVENQTAKWETWVRSLGWDDPL